MTTLSADAIHAEHEQLAGEIAHLRDAARELPGLSPEEREARVGSALTFLRGTLLLHAAAEEAGLYAEVGRVLGDERATAPMTYDHRAIARLVEELGRTPTDATARLQELFYGLAALIEVHFEKEEKIYLELVAHPGPSPDAGR